MFFRPFSWFCDNFIADSISIWRIRKLKWRNVKNYSLLVNEAIFETLPTFSVPCPPTAWWSFSFASRCHCARTFSAHWIAPRTNFSTSSFVLPACKQTRRRPAATVGGVIGLVLKPSVRKCAERDQGIEVISGMIWLGGKEVSLLVRWEGSERRSGGIAASLGRRSVIK